jgi:histidinol-phosphatase (PHP family)
MPEADFAVHYAEMVALRERYAKQIAVRVSVEADYVAGQEQLLSSILAGFSFDYVLGGVHFVDGWLIDDPATRERYEGEEVSSIYLRYYAALQQAICSRTFDLLAHFDLPKKFGYRPERDVDEAVEATLDLIQRCDVAVEVSSAGLRMPAAEIYPSSSILRSMKRRNIPVALSSDAHSAAAVGSRYDELLRALHEAGYREIVTFDQHQRRSHRIG